MLNPVEGALNDTADTVFSYWSAIIQLDNVRTRTSNSARRTRRSMKSCRG